MAKEKIILDKQTQEMIWNLLLNKKEVVADVFGTEVKLTKLPNSYSEMEDVIAEIEADPELQQMLLDSNEDMKTGRLFSTDEAIRYIKELHSK
jgi:hypothetical protein